MSITHLTLKLRTFKVKVTDNSWRSLYIWCVKGVIDHGIGTMNLNANYTFDLETLNLQGQGYRQRSRWKELMKVYLHLVCERVNDHGLGTIKLNANYTFDLEIWNIQGQGNRKRSRWKELMKVYLHLKCEKSYIPWCRYNEVKRQLHIWPWNLEYSRSRSQTKVTLEGTHQGLYTSEVWKSYWPWSWYRWS